MKKSFSWTVKSSKEERRILRKALIEAKRALDESRKSNVCIVGFNPVLERSRHSH